MKTQMRMSEATLQLEYLGIVKDPDELRRAARFIATGYVDKKRVRNILDKMKKAETYGDPSHSNAKSLRAEILKELQEELGD